MKRTEETCFYIWIILDLYISCQFTKTEHLVIVSWILAFETYCMSFARWILHRCLDIPFNQFLSAFDFETSLFGPLLREIVIDLYKELLFIEDRTLDDCIRFCEMCWQKMNRSTIFMDSTKLGRVYYCFTKILTQYSK